MNKTRYRIIFNSSRGCLMAVAETAAAQGKGAAGASRSAAAPLSGKATYSALTAVNCACKLFMGLITVCLPMFIIAPLGVQAQSVATRIVADPTAPTGQRPTVLTTANGVVQVDIRTPSAAGVSRNTYSQFDVGAAGAVLNNSRTAVQTQQGGWVQGNPWLATGTARVILNEVNSTDPSYLQGYVEVAGQRAQVIIANPSGIAVNGGGFINASGVTLTTGTPILNAGALDSFRVQGGQISVEGLGMDTRSADYTAILSRAVQVNAGIWAQQLQVVTGANDILATSVGADTQIQSAPVTSTAAVPVYALDVATLGGMYAGKIQLIGTEAGVGVRNAGLLQASSGPLTLNHQGWLSNSGSMQATGGDVQIQTQERIDQSGTIYSDKNVQLISNANQNHSGSTAALGDVHIRAMGLNADGTEANIQATKNSVWAAGLQTEGQITGQQTLMVQASGQVQTAGQALASQTLSMQASSLDVAQSRQQASTVTLQATSSDLQATGSRILVGQSLHLEAAKTLTTDQAQVQAQTLTLQANALSNKAGQITQTGSTEQSIRLQSTLDNTAGVIYSAAQTLNISAHSIDNTAGQILHAGQGTLAIVSQNQLTNHLQNSTQAAVADGARIIGAGEVQIQAQDLTNSGSIYAAQDVSTTAKSLNNSGSLYAGGAQTLSVTEAVQTSGTIAAAKNLTIQAQSLSATSTSVLAAGMAADGQLSGTGTLTAVTTGALQSAGQVLATQNLSLVGSSLDLSGSQTGTTSGDLRLTAHSGDIHTRQAQVSTPGKLSIAANSQSTQKLDNTEGTISAQQLDMQVAQLDNTDGLIWATDSLNISSDKLHNAQTATSSTPKGIQSQSGQLTLSAQALSNSGNIYAGQDLIANVTSLSNSGTLYASGSQSLSVTSDLSNSGTIAAAQDLKIQADNTSGTTTSVLAAGMTADGQLKGTGALTVSTTGSLQSAGQVLAAGALHMQGASLDLSQSTTGSTTGDVTLTASRGDILTRQAQISSPGLLKLSANAQATQKLDNTSGQISAKALDIQVGQLSNSQGQIQQTGTGVQTARIQSAAGITNTSGAILANAQDLTLSAAGALDNSEGQIGHAGTGQLNLTAASLNNTRGQVLGNGAQTWTVTGDANNTKGLVAAQSLDVTATGWNNTQGKLLSTQAGLSLRTSQNGITNTSGLIQSAQDLSLTGTGTNNKLQNSQGKIYAARDASVSTGNLNNDTALMAAGRNLSIDTHDQSLSNVGSRPASDSGANTAPAGLIAGGQLDITSGALDNRGGLISAQTALNMTSAGTVNNTSNNDQAGLIYSGTDLSLQARGLDNTGGQVLAVQNATLQAGTGTLTNTQGLVRVGQTLTVQTGSVDNTATRAFNPDGSAQAMGLEGGSIQITTGTLNNTQGAVRAAQDLSVKSDGQLTNDQGELSAGRNLQITTATATTPALRVSNAAGRMVADRSIQLLAGSLSGAGSITSGGDVSLSLQGDHTLAGTLQAGGSLSVQTTGTLTNPISVQAGQHLSVSANSLNNQATGELLSGQTTHVQVADTLTNRGLIDGADTRIQAQTVNNLGSGRIYGDRVAIAATSLTNQQETISGITRAATIAGRERVDMGVQTLTNQENALIYSGGDMAIGGALGANWRLSDAKASLITNQGASLEAAGNLVLQAQNVKNLTSGLTYVLQPQSGQPVMQYTTNVGVIEGKDVAWQPAGVEALVLKTHTYADPKFKAIYEGPNPVVPAYPVCTSWGDSDPVCTTIPAVYSYAASDAVWGIMGVESPTQSVWSDPSPWSQLQTQIDAMRANVNANAASYAGRQYRRYTETTNTAVVTGGLVGKIMAGQDIALNVSEQLLNQDSQMIAGGAITNAGQNALNKINNSRTQVDTEIKKVGTQTDWMVVDRDCGIKNWKWRCDDIYGWSASTYNQSTPTTTPLQIVRYEQFTSNASTGTAPTASTLSTVRAQASGAGTVTSSSTSAGQSTIPGTQASVASASSAATQTGVQVQSTDAAPTQAQQQSTTTNTGQQVTTAASNASGSTAPSTGNTKVATTPAAVRTPQPDTRIPTTSLYNTRPESSAKYLVETDPRFTNNKLWLGSDYMTAQLQFDPATTQKRLGDGFYEQKLVREQVQALTGQRFLGDYSNDETQYQALMNNGLTYAQALQLRPGIALTDAQAAQLSSDMVWLVTQEVTLADGTRQSVLVPQVYVRVRPGDVDGSGALLAGRDVNLNLTGDATNSGTVAGRNLVQISAANIRNLGGSVSGAAVALLAEEDIDNIGGQIQAQSSALLSAGRDINQRTTTQSSAGRTGASTYNQTGIDRVAGLYVSGPAGVLIASAGRDLNLTAAQISNQGTGPTVLTAGQDIRLGSINTAVNEDTTFGANRYLRTSQSQDIGSQINAAGSLSLQAGNDLNAKAVSVSAGQTLSVSAGRDVNITAGAASQSEDIARQTKSSGFLSSKTTTTRTSTASTSAVASNFEGTSVRIQAGQDVGVKASNILADQDVALGAGRNVAIEAAQNTQSNSSFSETKKSGLFSGGGLSITIGKQQQSLDQKAQSTTAAASTVGAIGGNVTVTAGQSYTQTGSDVLTPGGNIDITAKKVDINEARETGSQSTEQKFKQSGLTLAITSPVLSALQTVQSQIQAAGNTSSGRMQALAAANVAMNLKQAADAIQAGQAKEGANAADKAGGVGISISLGSSSSQSKQNSSADNARGSSVTAGGSIQIAAVGDAQNSNLTVQGSRIEAGQTTRLQADNQVKLLAAQNTTQESNSSQSKSGSIGVAIQLGAGGGGMGFTASASKATGQGAGNSLTYTNTQVAGTTVNIESGADTTLKGATVKGESVQANVGGNLTIESLQDTNQYKESNKSAGGSVMVGAGFSGSVNLAKSNINSNYQSVNEQTAIRAGDGGFQVKVEGQTTLTGAQITSTQAAVDNNKNSYQAQEGTSTQDLQNTASYEAKSVSVGVGTGSLPGQGPKLSSAGFGADSGNANSTSTAGISAIAGNTQARTGDKETGIGQIFDKDKVQKEVAAQVAITSEFGKQASKVVGDYAATKLKEAEANKDQAGIDAWKEGGSKRVALHAVVGGLTGGAQGAVGAGAASAAAPVIDQLQSQLQDKLQSAGLSADASKVIAGLAGGAVAATIGAAASGGSTAGAATAFNADMNNRQLHPSEKQKIKDLTKSTGLSEEKLTRAACYVVKCWAEFPEGSQQRADAYVSVAETFGLRKELAAIQSVGSSTGLFAYNGTDQLKDSFKVSALPVIKNSAKTVGGGLAIATGSTICSTSGLGCVVGAPLTVLGASEATEGATGLYRQYQGQGASGFNPVRSGLNAASPVWGDTIYDGTYLLLSAGAIGAPVALKVGASDGINRANSMFGVTVPRWQNPIINPLTNNVLLSPTAAQGLLLYGVGAKVPAVVEDVNNARGGK